MEMLLNISSPQYFRNISRHLKCAKENQQLTDNDLKW